MQIERFVLGVPDVAPRGGGDPAYERGGVARWKF